MSLRSVRVAAAFLALLVAVVCFVACGQKAPSGVPAGTIYSLTYGPITLAPGVEQTQCIVVPLGNPSPIHVGGIHDVLSNGSHHMIVYESSDTTPTPTPFDCQPFVDTLDPSKGQTLVVTQKKDDTLDFPPGVGITLAANQMIRIELHAINPGAEAIQVQATTNFITMSDSDYQYEAGFLFIGDPDITIPPNSNIQLGPIFFQVPDDYAQSQFFAITGHEHQLGTDVTVSVASSASDPGMPVYDVPGWLWSEPATVPYDPPFTIPSGGGFTFTCNWTNTTDETVTFGESANDEMCFFWAYYYPSLGSRVCMHSDQYGGINLCCPGPSLICDIIQSEIDDGGTLGSKGGGGAPAALAAARDRPGPVLSTSP
jgi:hypothetical protein